VHFRYTPLDAVGWELGRQEGHLACKKTEWWGAGVVICLERVADLHTAQLMPRHFLTALLLTSSFISSVHIPNNLENLLQNPQIIQNAATHLVTGARGGSRNLRYGVLSPLLSFSSPLPHLSFH